MRLGTRIAAGQSEFEGVPHHDQFGSTGRSRAMVNVSRRPTPNLLRQASNHKCIQYLSEPLLERSCLMSKAKLLQAAVYIFFIIAFIVC
jgi:hypothetical protein